MGLILLSLTLVSFKSSSEVKGAQSSEKLVSESRLPLQSCEALTRAFSHAWQCLLQTPCLFPLFLRRTSGSGLYDYPLCWENAASLVSYNDS